MLTVILILIIVTVTDITTSMAINNNYNNIELSTTAHITIIIITNNKLIKFKGFSNNGNDNIDDNIKTTITSSCHYQKQGNRIEREHT